MQAAVAGRGCLRGTFMRTAILSVLLAVISTAAPPQDPSKPITEQPRSQQKPTDPPLSVLCAPGTTIQLGVAYNSSVVASGGTGAYQFAITGGALPASVAPHPASGAINVDNGPEFSGSHMIRPDGKITLNFIGEVMAPGFTPLELSDTIKEKLKKYIVDPDVSVSVNAINSKKFYIQGEIMKPGAYVLLIPTKILEALVNAGNFKDFSNPKRIVIMHVDGERDKFNYKEVMAGKKMEQNIYVRPGDIILIK